MINTDLGIKLTWYGCFSGNTNVMCFEYNGNKFRILITNRLNEEPIFYPQYIDDSIGAVDFAPDTNYSYEECIRLIKKFELE